MTEEEKKAIEIIKFLQNKCIQENGTGMMPIYRIDDLVNAIKILLNLVEKQSKEIEFYKREELGYIAGYEDGKRHKQTAVAIRNENAQYEIIRKNIEIKNAKIEQLQKEIKQQSKEIEELKEKTKKCEYYEMVADELSKEIEELKKPKYIMNFETNEITTLTNDFISKDKIKAKIEEIKNDCKKCRFKGFCKDLLKNNQCSQGEAIKVLKKLLEG